MSYPPMSLWSDTLDNQYARILPSEYGQNDEQFSHHASKISKMIVIFLN